MHPSVDPTIQPSSIPPSSAHATNVGPVCHPWTSWAAVLAGVITAISVQIGLTELCVAMGLIMFEPTEPGAEVGAIAIGTVIAMMICALISVFIGGWVAGRMKFHPTSMEAAIHGMLVWAVAGLTLLLLTTMTIGMLAGGAFSLLGQAISGAAKGVGAAVPGAVEAVAPSWDDIKEEISGATEQADVASTEPASDSRFADRSRLMQLLTQSFTMDGDSLPAADREELTQLLSTQLGISPEAARATYEQWLDAWEDGVTRFEEAKEEAKNMALNAAEEAADRMAQAALIAFFVMVIGLGAAIAGALWGSACAIKCYDSRTVTGAPNRTY